MLCCSVCRALGPLVGQGGAVCYTRVKARVAKRIRLGMASLRPYSLDKAVKFSTAHVPGCHGCLFPMSWRNIGGTGLRLGLSLLAKARLTFAAPLQPRFSLRSICPTDHNIKQQHYNELWKIYIGELVTVSLGLGLADVYFNECRTHKIYFTHGPTLSMSLHLFIEWTEFLFYSTWHALKRTWY